MREEGRIVSPAPGVAAYRVPDSGAMVLTIHYTADKAKRDPLWAAEQEALMADRVAYLQEYELDEETESRQLVFWAWNEVYNVVKPFDIPSDWLLYLSFDFGQTDETAVLFYAQNPKTFEIVVWGEIYVKATQYLPVRREIYETVGRERGIAIDAMKLDDLVEAIVGDPQGLGYVYSYSEDPYPVYINTKGLHSKWGQKWKAPSEAKVNEFLSPRFGCCGKWWFTRDLALTGTCKSCGEQKTAKPILTVMEGRAPNLVRTLPAIVRVQEAAEHAGTGEKDDHQEDHAPASLRYGIMRITLGMPETPEERNLLTEPAKNLKPEELLQKLRLRIQLEDAQRKFLEENQDAYVIGSVVGEDGEETDGEDEDSPDNWLGVEEDEDVLVGY